MTEIASRPIQDRFNHLLKVFSNPRLLARPGLGNEVPFFLCPFKPEEAVAMARLQRLLRNRLESLGVRVLDIPLYDLSIGLLKERGIWDQILEIEARVSKAEFKELLQGVLDPETHLVPAIARRMKDAEFDLLFLSGIGEVFPYLRSHNLLNNLQSTAKEKPTLVFFPGAYTQALETGTSLDLFGRLREDKYYRAFDVYHYGEWE